ncbi:MAG: tyrosine-protein kinase family protein [Candidatus Woesearchaeota archaeon]
MNVLGIFSAKGGVGKSTVSVNLAVSLSRFGRNVSLIDFKGGKTHLSHFFGNEGIPGLSELSNGELDSKDVVYSYDPTLRVIPGGLNKITSLNLNTFEPFINKLKSSSEVVILDIPSYHSSIYEQVLDYVDYALIVSNLNKTSLKNSSNMISELKEEVTFLGTIINNNTNRKLDTLDQDYNILLKIPYNKKFETSYDDGIPFIEKYYDHDISYDFKEFSAELIGEEYSVKRNISIKRLFDRLVGKI